ncbi:MAG: ABC transporter ATP-binding protein [Chloroflexi bacterium]|nr:ABC transporter ATP-binding protein [Chloroflexota bacterium]MCI0579286.1 ABC transporter ATP-binding protein [Chloroflexota bacterium]MCI0644354.1 ABC transporter ATP-binding protein [Chloroflexota bacterium]MCI0728029.1 ABC transporter ATP-binding protein [Chloroflexota bacterium]
MSNAILQTYDLTKHYGDVVAVQEANLQVNQGEVFGFLGPNGAGKTTTIGLALGLVHPTAGRIEIFGQLVLPQQTRPLRQVGSLVGGPALLPYLSGRDNLRLLARLHPGVDERRIGDVLALVDMAGAAGRKVKGYSTGMKQRLGLAAALLHRPSLVILDEPTNGLDPAGMREVRNLIRALAESGATVFLSSHLLYEVEQVCDRIAVINHGRIVAQGPVNELLGQQEQVVRLRVPSPAEAQRVLQELPGVGRIETNGAYVEVSGLPGETLVAHLTAHGIVPGEVSIQKNDLESLFLALTQDS